MNERYNRQIQLLGEENQRKIQQAKVLVIGCGGLGSPTIFALAAAGVGTIGLVDKDVVEMSNLNRQILHQVDSIGTPKVQSAKQRVLQLNNEITVNTYDELMTEDLSEELFKQYDMIIDCVDNYETRKIVSKTAVKYNKVVIEAGIEAFQGMVQLIVPHKTACFNCFHLGNASIHRQVLGANTGIMGNIQALECIKQIIGQWNGDYSYIALNLEDYEVEKLMLLPNDGCNCQQ